ncbi:hypothetical protein VM1G_07420 [Cytospora mali]|uniref:Nephrocystin 3-like N-terminal domain-containing protein n=1 Tax=Cytospora mali TaxID=578113 RepID=A0A194W649_CYTMA|nr:hypothetical protein VM1G_07420 [Valsa mali]
MANLTNPWVHVPVLEVNGTGPSNSSNSTAPSVPGGIGGYVHSYILILVAAGVLIFIGLCLIPIGKRVRRHYHKKIDHAGDIAVSVTRPQRRGKSVLCSYAIETISKEEPKPATSYIYLKYGKERSKCQIAQTLASQLLGHVLREQSGVEVAVLSLLSQSSLVAGNLYELIRLLVKQCSSVYFFVEGLNEISSPRAAPSEMRKQELDRLTINLRSTIKFLAEMTQDQTTHVRLWCSSQNTTPVVDRMQGLKAAEMIIHKAHVERDVLTYLEDVRKQAIDRLSDPFDKTKVTLGLMAQAGSNFRWAYMMAKSIRACKVPKDLVQKVLHSLPRDLRTSYRHRLEELQVLDRQDLEDRNPPLSMNILSILAYARRPLALSELQEALSIINAPASKDKGAFQAQDLEPDIMIQREAQSLFVVGHFMNSFDANEAIGPRPPSYGRLMKRNIPEWFRKCDEGRLLVADYEIFISEWSKFLQMGVTNYMNGEIERCLWGALGQRNFLWKFGSEAEQNKSYLLGDIPASTTIRNDQCFYETICGDGKRVSVWRLSTPDYQDCSKPSTSRVTLIRDMWYIDGRRPPLPYGSQETINIDPTSIGWDLYDPCRSRSFPLVLSSGCSLARVPLVADCLHGLNVRIGAVEFFRNRLNGEWVPETRETTVQDGRIVSGRPSNPYWDDIIIRGPFKVRSRRILLVDELQSMKKPSCRARNGLGCGFVSEAEDTRRPFSQNDDSEYSDSSAKVTNMDQLRLSAQN